VRFCGLLMIGLAFGFNVRQKLEIREGQFQPNNVFFNFFWPKSTVPKLNRDVGQLLKIVSWRDDLSFYFFIFILFFKKFKRKKFF
jgi:hypothetical protein